MASEKAHSNGMLANCDPLTDVCQDVFLKACHDHIFA